MASTLNTANAFDVNMPAYHMDPEVSYSMRTSPPTPVGRNFSPEALQAATKIEYEAATGLRRPDVVVRRPGAQGGLSGNVIQRVWEMKFPGDSYGPGQREAYEKIAGDRDKFEDLDQDKCCNGSEERQGERVIDASNTSRNTAGRNFLAVLGLLGLGGLLGPALGGVAGGVGGLAPAF